MASSSKPKKIYDVFLSFRGMDLRNNFLGHLYKALDQNGIYTFVDSEKLRKGDQISPALMKAIEQSCIAIIVFSEDYASSQWCLEEVAKIMECKEQKDLTVLPVFYKVDPREVRAGRQNYQRALAKHESKFGKDLEKVKRWKKALLDAGSLSGWHLNDGNESELIQKIVKDISTRLDRTQLHVAKHPVGIDTRVVKLKLMLNVDSDDDVVMVGLWGPGGIGKTTLAKALYNAIDRQFEGSCFLANVRETSKGCMGLVTLQEKLLKDILLLQQKIEVSNVDEGINMIQHRLGRKKVLLILDDVDDLRQLNALAGEGKCFGNGSRIIITSRDKRMLTGLGIDLDHVYEVKALNYSEAHELLSNHAFPTHRKLEIRTYMVDSVLNHARGLPLALEVLGSFLCSRREREWESTLKKLSRIPDKTINDVLKISYDGLEENEKEIFLHIACFFKGKHSKYIKKVLDSCDFEATIGLEILIERSLISIKGNGFLKMHDLIQAMGIEIVNQECRDDPKRRSKLWLYDDVVNILSHDMGECAVKAIVFELPEPTEICIDPNAFTKMRRLRLLILHNVRNSFQGPIYLPNELRWFEWPGCALQIPEFSSGLKKLVGLDVSKCNITGVVKQFKGFQNLKYMNFSHCESLVRMPDLSCTPNLEELVLRNCKNLVEVHESLAYHDKLQVLNLMECSELSVFPNVLKSKNLRDLDLSKCTKFERFPDIPHKLEGLKKLDLDKTAITELPASIENLVSLEIMDINDCKNLVSLPPSIYKLQNLEILRVECCTNLIGFPKYEDSADPCMKTGFSNLHFLDLKGCNLSEVDFLENLSCFPLLSGLVLAENDMSTLPTSIDKRDHLILLGVENCHQLQEIPRLPLYLRYLRANNCESLQKNEDLTSIHHFVRRGLADPIDPLCQPELIIILPEGEMPQWIIPIEEGFVAFTVSEDLYDKILGLIFCYVLSNDEQKEPPSFNVEIDVNGERPHLLGRACELLDSDHICVDFFLPSELWGEVDFAKFNRHYIHFRLNSSGRGVKKWGFRIICKQLGDDLKVELRDNQLIDLSLLYEVGRESTDSEAESSHMYEDSSIEADLREGLQDSALFYEIGHDSIDPEAESSHMHGDSPIEIDLLKTFQDCQMSTEEHSQIVSKRNHELILPRGKRTKTMLTSNSTNGDENGSVGWLHL